MLEDIVCRVVSPCDVAFHRHASQVMARINPSCQMVLVSLLYCNEAFSQRSTFFSCHYRLWIASMMLADIYLNDNSYTSVSWAEVSGLAARECAYIKTALLQMLGWSLEISTQQYSHWLEGLSRMQQSMRKPTAIPAVRSNALFVC
jgi:hypothetical protein